VLRRQDASACWLVRLLALPVLLTVLSGYVQGILNIERALGRMALAQTFGAKLNNSYGLYLLGLLEP